MKAVFALASYIVGSIPTGYLLVRLADRKDIRQFGSRSTGATNVLRLRGPKFAVPVAVIDLLKGFVPAHLAMRTFGDPVFAAFCAFLSVLGHCYPFWIGFRGGKGVATSLGAYAAIAWRPLLAALAVFAVSAGATRYVSLGSILASAAFPLLVLAFGGPKGVFLISLAISALIIFKHAGNIGRLVKGRERKLGEKTS